MNTRICHNSDLDRLRSYSSVFSRSVFTRMMKFDDFSAIDLVCKTYDSDYITHQVTYGDYLDKMYLSLALKYRTEYVYKNSLLNMIVSIYRSRKITVFNEFKVGDSIADVATFNGKSCVYEIKTALDTPKRLASQTEDYLKFFQECYLVVPIEMVEDYAYSMDERVGVLTVREKRGNISISKYRAATTQTDNMDVDVLMRVLWIQEYESIIKRYFGKLPDVGYYEMYDACKEMMKRIPVEMLSKLTVDTIKKRKNSDLLFDNEKKNLTQMCLALNINMRQYAHLCDNLNKTIIL